MKCPDELFHSSGMGLNVCCIGSSDYSTKMYSYDEGDPDPELKRFSIAQDRLYLLPILHEARKANPENSGLAQTATVRMGAMQADIELGKESVTTWVWSREV